MDRVVETEQKKMVTVKTRTHEFFCDECNKYLGESAELDDGYYEEKYVYEAKFFVPGTSSSNAGTEYIVHKHLCESHKESFRQKLVDSLEALGFVEYDYYTEVIEG